MSILTLKLTFKMTKIDIHSLIILSKTNENNPDVLSLSFKSGICQTDFRDIMDRTLHTQH